jgi:hypothetical protein
MADGSAMNRTAKKRAGKKHRKSKPKPKSKAKADAKANAMTGDDTDSTDEVGTPNDVEAKARAKKPKPKPNRQRTIENYMDRMRLRPRESFLPLKDAYLSTYDIYSTVHALDECSRFMFFNVPVIHLMTYVRNCLGIPVRGVTSERRRKNGEYICAERAGPHKVVYTGRYNYFSKTETSPWAVSKKDMAFYEDDEDDSEPTFAEYL